MILILSTFIWFYILFIAFGCLLLTKPEVMTNYFGMTYGQRNEIEDNFAKKLGKKEDSVKISIIIHCFVYLVLTTTPVGPVTSLAYLITSLGSVYCVRRYKNGKK